MREEEYILTITGAVSAGKFLVMIFFFFFAIIHLTLVFIEPRGFFST